MEEIYYVSAENAQVNHQRADDEATHEKINAEAAAKIEPNGVNLSSDPENIDDSLVRYTTYSKDREKRDTSNYRYKLFFPYRFGLYPFGNGIPYGSSPGEEGSTERKVMLDIINFKTGEVIWSGSVSGIVKKNHINNLIRKGITELIENRTTKE